MEGKYTVERVMKEKGIGRQSAINLLSRLKKKGFIEVSGGCRTITISVKTTPTRVRCTIRI